MIWSLPFAAAGLIGLGVATLVDNGSGAASRISLKAASPPLPPVNRLRALTSDQAVAANAKIATSAEPIEPARPFLLPATLAGELSRSTALDCLTAAVYYESASESTQGQRAVAQVVLNRVRHPAFPKSVCGVVYQGSERRTGCQFSFTCDGSLARRPSRIGWDRATFVAATALNGLVEPAVGTATHYHTVWVLPYWADSLTKLGTIGAHIFYRWSGYWGKRAAFTGRYEGEPQGMALDGAAATPESSGASVADPMVADAAPLTRLLADENRGQLGVSNAPLVHFDKPAADASTDTPLADERRGVLRLDQPASVPPPQTPG